MLLPVPLAPPVAPTLPADQVLAFVLIDIGVILVAARLCGALAQRVGQPRVVGEIVAGVLIGPSVLGRTVFAWDHPWKVLACDKGLGGAPGSIGGCLFPTQARAVLGPLGQLALLLFMFLVGLELDAALLRGRVRAVLGVAAAVVGVPLAAGFAIAPALYNVTFVAAFGTDRAPSPTAFALFCGAMLSVTAFPVAARILQEKGLARSEMGAVGLAAAAVVTIGMFLLVGVARGVAARNDASTHVWRLIGTAAFVGLMYGVVRPVLARLVGRAWQGRGELPTEVFVGLLIVVLAAGYAADRIGINIIVGGFVAGTIVPHREAALAALAPRLNAVVVSVLLPIFLAVSGLQTDLSKLTVAALGGLVLFLVAGVASKWAAGLLAGRLMGLTWPEGNVIGVLMNCRGLLVLVVGLVGVSSGVISPVLQVGGVLMALATTAMTGPLLDRSVPTAAAT